MSANSPIKVTCEHCGARYSMGEDRVRGRVLRIRCKSCHKVFEVRGASQASSLVSRGKRWFLVVKRERVGPVTAQEVHDRLERGEIKPTTYAWRRGFAKWERLVNIPEFVQAAKARMKPARPKTGPTSTLAPSGRVADDRGLRPDEPTPLASVSPDAVDAAGPGESRRDGEWPEATTAVVSYDEDEAGEVRARYEARSQHGLAVRATVPGVGSLGESGDGDDLAGGLLVHDTLPGDVELAPETSVPDTQVELRGPLLGEARTGEADHAVDVAHGRDAHQEVPDNITEQVRQTAGDEAAAAGADLFATAAGDEEAGDGATAEGERRSLFEDDDASGTDAAAQPYQHLKGQRSESSVLFSLQHLLKAAAHPRMDGVARSAARPAAPAREPVVVHRDEPSTEPSTGGEPGAGDDEEQLDIGGLEVKPVEGPAAPRVLLPDPTDVSRSRRSPWQLMVVGLLGVMLGAAALLGIVYLVNPGAVRSLWTDDTSEVAVATDAGVESKPDLQAVVQSLDASVEAAATTAGRLPDAAAVAVPDSGKTAILPRVDAGKAAMVPKAVDAAVGALRADARPAVSRRPPRPRPKTPQRPRRPTPVVKVDAGEAGDEPAGDEPAGDEPAGDEPAGDEPAGDRPVDDGAEAPGAKGGSTIKAPSWADESPKKPKPKKPAPPPPGPAEDADEDG